MQSPVIEHLMLLINDEGHDSVSQAFLKHDESADTAVAILKRMDGFKLHMERKNILQCFFFSLL